MKFGTVWALGRFDDPAKLQKKVIRQIPKKSANRVRQKDEGRQIDDGRNLTADW